jgi:hypothetical protein
MKIKLSKTAALSALALSAQVHATDLTITPNGVWNPLDVDDLTAQSSSTEWIDNTTGIPGYTGNGSSLTFSFTLASSAVLDIVDAGFAGDTFGYSLNGGSALTSNVPVTEYNANPANAGTNFDAAFSDHANFSFASLVLAPGSYTLTGALAQSVTLSGLPLNATVGAVRLSAVPVPAALWLMGSAIGGLVSLRRRA